MHEAMNVAFVTSQYYTRKTSNHFLPGVKMTSFLSLWTMDGTILYSLGPKKLFSDILYVTSFNMSMRLADLYCVRHATTDSENSFNM